MKLEHLGLQGDSSIFSRRENRDSKMATEGCRYAGRRTLELWSQEDINEELAYIKREMVRLELKLWQDKKSRCVYEWPMKKPKMKCPVRGLMVIRQHKMLKIWLRYAENLKATEEEMVHLCEPEMGESLNDLEIEMGLTDDLKHCQEGREEIPYFQMGNEMRSLRDLRDCQEDSQGISNCQLGNEMRSLRDLVDGRN
jgi:hypothetical protein